MALYNNILESVKFIAGGIAEKKNKAPIAHLNDGRGMTSISSGNELNVSAVGTVYSCMQVRANGLLSVDMKAYKELNWEKEELSNAHWINRLLANPNPYFTRSQIMKAISNWHDVNGNVFVWTPTLGHDVPLQMWVLNPTRMRVIRGGDNFIRGYVYQSANDGAIALDEKEVCHIANIIPSSRKPDELIGMNVFGTGLVSAALPYANINTEVSEYLQRFFANNAVPPVVAESNDNVDSELWESLKNQWNEALPNYKLKALLSGGLKLALPPEPSLQVSFDSVSKDVRNQIAQVFGVPSGMLTGEYQNRATAEVQYAVFRQQTIDPMAIYIAEELTRHFRRFEDSVLIESMPYEFKDVDSQIKQEEFELKYGIRTINDSRRERGYDTIQGGDSPFVITGIVPLESAVSIGQTDSIQPRALQVAKKGIQERMQLKKSNVSEYYWRQMDEIAVKVIDTIEPKMLGIVGQFNQAIWDAVEIGTLELLPSELTAEQVLELQMVIDVAVENTVNEVAANLEMGMPDLEGQFGLNMVQLSDDVNSKISESINKTNQYMKEQVMSEVALNPDKNSDELKVILTKRFGGDIPKHRINAIARTSATAITTGSQKNVFVDLGVEYVWMTERDKQVRPSHKRLDGRKTNAAGYFELVNDETGETFMIDRPAGNGIAGGKEIPASEAVNCRCYLMPVV